MINLSKLPAPNIIEELDYETILAAMRTDLEGRLPGWTAAELESDPANKILEVAAYRELLLRQRINEAIRACMLAFAAGSDLEHLSAFYAVSRLPGARAVFTATITLSAALTQSITIPDGFTVIDAQGNVAELVGSLIIAAGQTSGTGTFEITTPEGEAANGLSSDWDAITPLPWVVKITQTAEASGGSDAESDEALRQRTQLSPESWSTAGSYGAYEYWALSADERIADIHVSSPTPGSVQIVALSNDGDGTADTAMINRIEEICGNEKVRPLTDNVTVISASQLEYAIAASLVIEQGVSAEPVIAAAKSALNQLAKAKHKINAQVPLSAIIAAAHVEGVRKITLTAPTEDVSAAATQAPYCTGVSITWSLADD